MERGLGPIPGYEAPIHRSMWERILQMGAPRLWATVWLAGCLYAGLVIFLAAGFRWVVGVGVAWAIGQGLLIMLTQWDEQWDDIVVAKFTRRYKHYYEA